MIGKSFAKWTESLLWLRMMPWPGACISSVTSWWRHQMKAFYALLDLCAGYSPVNGEFSAQRPVTRSFEDSFDLCLNQYLSKQWIHRWFETPSSSLRRHCNIWHQLLSRFKPAQNGFHLLRLIKLSTHLVKPALGLMWVPGATFTNMD